MQERASALQLSTMNQKVVTLRRSPCSNFATLVPFEERVTRRNKFSLPYVVHGQYHTKEQPGPATYSEWSESYRIFSAIARSLMIEVHSALVAYERRIEQLIRDYPEA